MIGKTLGHYQVIERLGAGGMGVVYKAKDLHLDRFVALKILPPEKVANRNRKLRFIQEAKAASSLNHPNIVHIYDINHDAGVDFIAMEYVAGQTLDQRIGRRGLRLSDALKYGIQIADALAKAHAISIVHRDLKPSNIMVNEDGAVKILDFGLVKLTEQVRGDGFTTAATSDTEPLITKKGTIVGTAAYMSPEQVEGDEIDARSDIFSFGSVLYEMVTGQRAFQGDSEISVLWAILNREPVPLGDEIPRDLERIISRCLRKDPERRFQHMEDLKVALEELKEESDSGKLASGVSTSFQVRRGLRIQRMPWIISGALLVVLAAGVSAWLILNPPSRLTDRIRQSESALGGRLTLLYSSEGRASEPTISPDGKMIGYIAEDQGQEDLFVSRVAGGGRVRLTNDVAREEAPDFSPDGERLVFTRYGSEARVPELWVVPTLGGPATRLVSGALDAVWSPDGNHLAFVLRRPGEGDKLVTAAADGTNPVVVLKSDGTYPFFRQPAWSPDGSQLVVVRSTGGIAGELWLVPLNGGSPRPLSGDPTGVSSNHPVFSADGRGVIHQSNRTGAANLWILPLNGGQPIQLTAGPGPDETPSVASNGAIVFANARSRCALIVCNLGDGQNREILTHSSYLWAPAFSPDGRELAFSRYERDGSWHIWMVSIHGGDSRQLTSGALPEIYPRYTPDGASVIYHTWSPGPDRIWRVPREGGPPAPLTPARDDDDGYADVSPDGERIAFARSENGNTYICVAPFGGSQARRLSDVAATLPRWSPDGRWIAFAINRGYTSGIFIVGSSGGEMRRLSETGGWPVWWPDGRRIGFQALGLDGNQVILTVPFAGGSVQSLRTAPFKGTNNPFDISPDGALLATSNCTDVSSEIWLLEPQQ